MFDRTPRLTGRALAPGVRLGRYQVLELLARGGMAELYLARATGIERFERLVAIKRVHPHLSSDAEFVAMFLREARLAGKLDHPNVVPVLDVDVADEEYYFAMEYLHGEDALRVLKAAAGELSREVAVAIVVAAAAGLHHAHERCDLRGRPLGIVHRDVSPSNVMVTFEGAIKVVDFGIAQASAVSRMTRADVRKGKMGYMSPEQCQCGDLDRRSDVFGLGILLYELTVGRRAFMAGSEFAVLNQIISGKYKAPSEAVEGYPPALEAIIRRALEVDPADRYGTAGALREELEAFADEAGLRTSASVVAQEMKRLFGARDYPSVTELVAVANATSVATAITPEGKSIREPRARAWRRGIALAGLFLSAGVGLGLALAPSADDEEPASVGAEPANAVLEGSPVPERVEASPKAAPVDVVQEAGPDPASETPHGMSDRDDKRSPRQRKRPLRKKKPPKARDQAAKDNFARPPSHYKSKQ